MKLIITGAGGLLGHGLADAARKQGHNVVGVGRSGIPDGWTAGEWVSVDLSTPAALRHDWAAHEGACVCHLAADTRIYDASWNHEAGNVRTTETACQIARRTGGRLVLLSSSAVYSGPRTFRPVQPLREPDETCPLSAYGQSKLKAERVVLESRKDAIVLRLFSVLSERYERVPDRGNLVQAIFRVVRTDGTVTVTTDSDGLPAIRDYVPEAMVHHRVLQAATAARPDSDKRTFNLCTGVATSAVELVECASRRAPRPIQIVLRKKTAAVNSVMLGDPSELNAWLGAVQAQSVSEFWGQVFRVRGRVA